MPWSTAVRTVIITLIWAIWHSALASSPVKEKTRDFVGPRMSDGLYRFSYCGVSVLSFAAYLKYLWPMPDRRLYRMQGWKRGLMLGGQALAVAALLYTNWQNRLGHVTGIRHAWEFVTGQKISPSPVAQHPLPDGECMEGWREMFRLPSHPNNYLVLGLWWLSPVMTLKWASAGTVTAVYMVLGSMHEDHRLQQAYGKAYDCYRDHVPHWFMLPVDHWKRSNKHTGDQGTTPG